MNISKKKFPYFYDIYNLNKRELGDYLNIWFQGVKLLLSDLKNYKVKVQYGTIEDAVYTDEMWTVKKVDTQTAWNLYNKKYNPISLRIGLTKIHKDEPPNSKKIYQMKAQIHSIDDSQYGILFTGCFDELVATRLLIMKWIHSLDIVSGEAFLQYCISVGADHETVDYN